MKNTDTTYGRTFTPKYASTTCHTNRRFAARNSNIAREVDQVRQLLLQEEDARAARRRLKSNSCQTDHDQDQQVYAQAQAMHAMHAMHDPRSNSPYRCHHEQYYQPQATYASTNIPQPNNLQAIPSTAMPAPFIIVDQSPIPGVNTGSPGLQVPIMQNYPSSNQQQPQQQPPAPSSYQMGISQSFGAAYWPPPQQMPVQQPAQVQPNSFPYINFDPTLANAYPYMRGMQYPQVVRSSNM